MKSFAAFERSFSLAFLLAFFLVQNAAQAEEPSPLSPARQELRIDLFASGGTLLAAGYATSTISTMLGGMFRNLCGLDGRYRPNGCPTSPGFFWGFLPVIGPFVQVAYDHRERSTVALYVIPGVAQVVGLGMLIAGGVVGRRPPARRPQASMISLPGGAGVAISGRF